MTTKLINNTTADITLSGTQITIPANGEVKLLGQYDKGVVSSSSDFYELVISKAITVHNGVKGLPAQLGIALVRGFSEPLNDINKFGLEVTAGNLPNFTPVHIAGYSESVSSSDYYDVWGVSAANIVLPAGNETYRILSSSTTDTAAGTGARQIRVKSLDVNGVEQEQIVSMNGTTAVTLTGSHSFPISLEVVNSGSNQANLGTITLQESSLNFRTRLTILPYEARSFTSVYKVPTGKSFYPERLEVNIGGTSKPITIKTKVFYPSTNTWQTTRYLPSIENAYQSEVQSMEAYPAGTVIKHQAKLDSGSSGKVFVMMSGYLKNTDN